jgi:hypothetical protein
MGGAEPSRTGPEQAWPDLPEAVRQAEMALVKAAPGK